MTDRTRRIGQNEAVFREVNEQIETLNKKFEAGEAEAMRIVCECGELTCYEVLLVSVEDYERVRSDPTLFLVVPGHEQLHVEAVVEESPEFNVIRKHDAEAAEVARESDPRAG